jgi:ATP-binding protein involved in chromosome partitioning
MADITQDQIIAALEGVVDPEIEADVVSAGMISGVTIKDGHVGFAVEVAAERGAAAEPVRKAAEKAVFDLPGVLSVTAVLTAERAAAPGGPGAQARPAPGPAVEPDLLPEVSAIVAVASGKGGVGKSTIAVNLALAAAASGLTVGLLDADIYGPSQPRMMGLRGQPMSDGRFIIPKENYGVKVMSIGFMVAEDTPMIWRGPMVMGAIQQMLGDVAWGKLDLLFLDMPPGTGDAQLTVAQRVPLTGAVIVSTPQDIALLDAKKGLNMFRKVDVPVLGIVENMSYFTCPHCGERSDIFSHGGARRQAEELGMEFLGEIPLAMPIRETSDGGMPIVAASPESEYSKSFVEIAGRIWEKCVEVKGGAGHAAPRTVIE